MKPDAVNVEVRMMSTRRDFLRVAGGITAGTTVFGVTGTAFAADAAAPADAQPEGGGGAVTEHKLPPLPYAYDALEPHIDAKTMELHHGKHHAAYVKGLNEAETALAKARVAGDFAAIQALSKKAAFHGGGHALHSLFWTIMAPAGKGGGGEPAGDLADRIKRDFGSLAAFKAQFSAAAVAVEGGGWAMLAYRPSDDRLIVLQVENQHKLSPWDAVPVLALDVWEHAYYLKYQNKRPDYVEAWWNVVNWAQVQKNLDVLQRLRV
jgi:Fe-Mn family superoxide dismutase